MKRTTAALVILLGLGSTAPRPAGAYSGIGSAAVELAVGKVPESEDALDDQIRTLEATAKAGSAGAETSYALGILKLNRPRGWDLGEPRRHLGQAVVADPGFRDALEVWLDLIPQESDLKQAEEGLRARLATAAADAPAIWALASVEWRLGRTAAVEGDLDQLEKLDPAYRGRASWLRAVLWGEKKADDKATKAFLAAVESLDPPTASLMYKSAVLVATPEEIARYKNSLSLDAKDFFLSFWKRRDAFPLTEANERLGEHLRRLKRAREDFALRSNARAYLTTHDTFKQYSPDLPFYSSDVVYDYQERMPCWLDHRGLVYVRHGEPDRMSRSTQLVRSETWLYARLTFKPLLFHFVDRRGIDEFVLTLNLAQAMVETAIEDDPKQVLLNARNFQDLYASRSSFHPLFQRVAVSRSSYEVDDLLNQEAALMATFLREAWYDDTNNLIEKDDILPFAAYGSNFRAADGKVDAYVYYAIPERELKIEEPALEFDATIVLFSANWSERVASAEHHFRFERKPGKKPSKEDLLVGAMEVPGIEPGRYNFAFQVQERKTGKIGIAKGRFVADYFGSDWVDVSDLLLAGSVAPSERSSIFERRGQKIIPMPTRTFHRQQPGKIYFEIYDLKPAADGNAHYRIEYRILQVQQEPSVAEKILGIGMNVASAFFPYQIFLARAGLFGLGVVAQDPNKGLEVKTEERQAPSQDVVAETFPIDTRKLAPGIYQAYVTVKDYVSGSLSTRSVRFAVDG